MAFLTNDYPYWIQSNISNIWGGDGTVLSLQKFLKTNLFAQEFLKNCEKITFIRRASQKYWAPGIAIAKNTTTNKGEEN